MVKLISFVLGSLALSVGALIWYTSQGSVAAAMTLGGLIALVLVTVGFGMSQLSEWLNQRRNQQNFVANAQENMAIMANTQKVLNSQNQQLLRQAREVAKLPSGEDEVFDATDYVDLDNLEIEGL
jgi:uncharacterized protein HemX